MNKSKKIIGVTLTLGAMVASVSVLKNDYIPQYALAEDQNNTEKQTQDDMTLVETVNSIRISPNLDIPEQELLRNQKVDEADVKRTMNLGPINAAKVKISSEINAGIEENLGVDRSDLSTDLVMEYMNGIVNYVGLVEGAYQEATSVEDMNLIQKEFLAWKDMIKTKIEEEKAEKQRLLDLEEQQKNNETNEVNEVVLSTITSSNLVMSDRISYALPKLGDEYLTYMSYKAITARTTPHWRLQQIAKTDDEGYRTHEGYRSIALASSFGTQIGTLYEIVFEDGKVLKGILADNKSDNHTDTNKQYRDASGKYDGSSGNIVEIVFDTDNFSGMQEINKKINSDYPAKVKSITKVGVAKGFEK